VKNLILSLFIIAVTLGCAKPTHRIDISYAPRPDIKLIQGAHTINVFVEVKDSRLEKYRLTNKRNTFIETTNILVKNDVTSALRWAVETELKNLGFTVGNPPHVYIMVELIRFNNDYEIEYINGQAVADMHILVQVRGKNRQFRYATTVSTQAAGDDTILSRSKVTRLALNKSLETGMDKLFADKAFLAAILKKDP
jgi:uncharacterized lipoprotein YajG